MSFLKTVWAHLEAIWGWLDKVGIPTTAERELFTLADNYIKAFYPSLPVPTPDQEVALVQQLFKIHTASEFVVTIEQFVKLVLESQPKG